MLIDWFTVGAQVLNFIILVWLMKRFLYKPILNAIDAREKRIASELADADAKMAEALKEREAYEVKNKDYEQNFEALMKQAKEDATAERQRLIGEARQAADELSSKRQAALRNEAKTLNESVMRTTRDEVFAIARKTLTDLAGTSLEEQMGLLFMQHLRELNDETKQQFTTALKSTTTPARVSSAYELSKEQQLSIQNALNETFSFKVPVQFESGLNLISGIELVINGQKLAWSITEYLKSMEQAISDLITVQDQQAKKDGPKAEVQKDSESRAEATSL